MQSFLYTLKAERTSLHDAALDDAGTDVFDNFEPH